MPRRARPNSTEPSDAAATEIRAQARDGGSQAISELLRLAHGAQSEAVQLAAIKELLDRGFGRVATSEPAGAMVTHLLIEDGYAH